jgi:hypothetical protein
MSAVFGALIDLGGVQRSWSWGWFRVTVANAVVVALALGVFVGAVAGRIRTGEDR